MSSGTGKIPVIIDTDPGVDDVLAILLALASPELEILGFVVSYGNTDVDSSYTNILKIYATLARHFESCPEDRKRFANLSCGEESRPYLSKGPEGPLEGEIHSAQYFHGRDGLGDITTRYPNLAPPSLINAIAQQYLRCSNKLGKDLALELIRSRPPRTITYIALGPLTNLALMMRQDPTTVRERLGRVVCMGGALDVSGNATPVAEFNFFADPHAVHELLTPDKANCTFPLDRFLLLPLDTTTHHELHFRHYTENVDPSFATTAQPSIAEEKHPLHHFTSSFLERTREVMLKFGKDAMELHDIAAVWCAMTNPPVLSEPGSTPTIREGWEVERRRFQVERRGEFTRGMLVVDRRDDAGTYAPVQASLEKAMSDQLVSLSSNTIPAPVQVESPEAVATSPPSPAVACIVRTPGGDELARLMMSRIWGVEGPMAK